MGRTLALALLLALAAGSQAARFPTYGAIDAEELPKSLVDWQSSDLAKDAPVDNALLGSALYNDLEALADDPALNKHRDFPIHIATKFLVKPDLQINFVVNYWRYARESYDVKGIKHLSLSKVSGDNIVWTSYTVYRDVHALFSHLRSDGLRDFGSFLTNSNVALEYKLLFRVGGCRHNGASENGCFEPNMVDESAEVDSAPDNKKGGGKHRGSSLKLITKYIVPPGEGREFIREFERAERSFSKARGNLAFGLMKPADDNVVFVGFSAWKSREDFFDAAKSRASEDWLEFLGDRGVVAITRKLYTIPNRRPRSA